MKKPFNTSKNPQNPTNHKNTLLLTQIEANFKIKQQVKNYSMLL